MNLLLSNDTRSIFKKLGSKSLILVVSLKNNFGDFLYSLALWFSFILVIISLQFLFGT